jgi:hypothetical protein
VPAELVAPGLWQVSVDDADEPAMPDPPVQHLGGQELHRDVALGDHAQDAKVRIDHTQRRALMNGRDDLLESPVVVTPP